MRKLLFLGLFLSLVLATSTMVYADRGAQVTISSINVSPDGRWIKVTVAVQPKPNGQLSGQVLLSLESSFLTDRGLRIFDHQTAVVDAGGYVQYTFPVPFQRIVHYKFVAKAFTYPAVGLLGVAVADPPAVGTD